MLVFFIEASVLVNFDFLILGAILLVYWDQKSAHE